MLIVSCGTIISYTVYLNHIRYTPYRLPHQSTFTLSNLNKSIYYFFFMWQWLVNVLIWKEEKSVKPTKTAYINNVPWQNIFNLVSFRESRNLLAKYNGLSHHIKLSDGCEWHVSIIQCSNLIDLNLFSANFHNSFLPLRNRCVHSSKVQEGFP